METVPSSTGPVARVPAFGPTCRAADLFVHGLQGARRASIIVCSPAAGPCLPGPAPGSQRRENNVKWALASRALGSHSWSNLAASRARGQEVVGLGPLGMSCPGSQH